MKGSIRIGGALFLGIVMVLGAFMMRSPNTGNDVSGEIIVLDAPTRSYIDTKDSDGDGIKDWEENIRESFVDLDGAVNELASLQATYTPPTSLTGKFSEAFLQDYLEGKMLGQDFSDPTAFVGSALEAIEENATAKIYTDDEFVIISDSDTALHTYGNSVVRIINTHTTHGELPTVILERALKARDPNMLVELEPITNAYANALKDTLALSVPKAMVIEHTALINAYSAILTDMQAMERSFEDPLYTLARIRKYNEDQKSFFNSLRDIGQRLTDRGVIYSTTDSGYFFEVFKL